MAIEFLGGTRTGAGGQPLPFSPAVKAGPMPGSVRDLADPRFKDKACLANPLFGTTSMHAAALDASTPPSA